MMMTLLVVCMAGVWTKDCPVQIPAGGKIEFMEPGKFHLSRNLCVKNDSATSGWLGYEQFNEGGVKLKVSPNIQACERAPI